MKNPIKKDTYPLYLKHKKAERIYIILIFLLAWSSHLSAQQTLTLNIDSIYTSGIGNDDKIDKVVQVIQAHDTSIHTPELGYAYHRLGLLYNKKKQYQKAIDATRQAVRMHESVAEIDAVGLNNSLFNISIYLRKLGQEFAGEAYLNKIIDLNSSDRFYYAALNSLALLQLKKGDYFAALEYLKTSITSIDKEKHEALLMKAHRESIGIYSKMPYPEKYMQDILEHEQQLKNNEQTAEEMVNVNVNLGIIYSRMRNNKKAIEHYLQALPVYVLHQDSIGLGDLFNNLGIEYSILNQPEKAMGYYEKALRYADLNTRAYVYDNQGFYLPFSAARQKLHCYQKAINTILGQENIPVDIYSIPDLSILDKLVNRVDILSYLIDKATAWVDLYDNEKNAKYLIHAKKTLDLIDHLVSAIRQDSESKKSKLLWINHGVDSYVLAVKVAYLLEQPEEAFYFMEKNKSLLLLENLAKEHQPRIGFLDILPLKKAIEIHVSDHANFVEFILNKKEGFAIFCSENDVFLYELDNVPLLNAEMARLKNMVKRPFTSKSEFEIFDELSNDIYRKIFSFKGASHIMSDKKLNVIPDYELHNLPFELLVTQKNENQFEKNYLIKATEISYLHSCSVFQQIDRKECNKENKMIGFVPTIFQNDTLTDLHLSEIEMKKIATFFPTQLILREQATKNLFIESLGKYSIIHINSHAGYTKNQTPWLSFYDENVNIDELTTYSNHSNLVILDACKSALGEQELGEGIMSLSRAFFYGGTSSVIASQWQVNEKSSAAIFNKFYKNLKAGASKSKALHRAKLSYLQSNQLAQLSPYYWAAFTLTGDAGFVPIKSSNYRMELTLGILVFLILFFFLKKNAP